MDNTTAGVDIDERLRELRAERAGDILLRGVRWLAIGATILIPVSGFLGRYVFA